MILSLIVAWVKQDRFTRAFSSRHTPLLNLALRGSSWRSPCGESNCPPHWAAGREISTWHREAASHIGRSTGPNRRHQRWRQGWRGWHANSNRCRQRDRQVSVAEVVAEAAEVGVVSAAEVCAQACAKPPTPTPPPPPGPPPPRGPPGPPAPPTINCDPKSVSPQVCPGGKPCPQCGLPACPCPPWMTPPPPPILIAMLLANR
jgi:hypothetical protein